jgi:hypothetical protein
MHTAVLEALCGPLCDYLLDGSLRYDKDHKSRTMNSQLPGHSGPSGTKKPATFPLDADAAGSVTTRCSWLPAATSG